MFDTVEAFFDRRGGSLSDLAQERAAERNWFGLSCLVNSEERIALARVIWPMLRADERPAVLADAISGGDNPAAERAWLRKVLRETRGVFDGPEAEAAFDALPGLVRISRGTVLAEWRSGKLGVCWTLDRERAVWFAKEHGRFRNRASPPVLLQADLPKAKIAGYLAGRDEAEALVVLDKGDDAITCERLEPPEPLPQSAVG